MVGHFNQHRLSPSGDACTAVTHIVRLEKGEALDKANQAMFVGSIVLVYFFPVCYQAITDAIQQRKITAPIGAALGVFVSLFVGAFTYAKSFPELYFPEKFDILGNSHQIMHVGVATAHISEFIFILDLAKRCSG